MKITLIAAIGQKNEIGINGDLIWRMPGDLARAKEISMGHPVIMGRKTYESIPANIRPLPGRTNIVLTSKEVQSDHPDLIYVSSVQKAIRAAKESEGSDKCYVFGGAQVYRDFLPYATALELTMIDAQCIDADTFFPRWDKNDFQEVSRESIVLYDPQHHFVLYEKKR